MEELLSQKATEKESDNSKIKTQRKISLNNSDINSFAIKSETNTDIKKISERRMFEYKINKKFQAVKQKMQINKNRKKNGNRYVLLNTRNLKNIEGFTTDYIFKGKNDSHNENNSLQNSTNLTIDSNRTFQKTDYVKKILNPILVINTHYQSKNRNDHILKSCNLEKNHCFNKKRKIYANKGRNIKSENIFRMQSKFKNNMNYFSVDNSIINSKNHKSKNILNQKKKHIDIIEIPSNLGQSCQSFDLPKNIDLSSSNSNISKKTINQALINNILLIEKPIKKSSNIDLRKNFLYQIKNIFLKKNILKNNKFLSINKNNLIKKSNVKSNDLKSFLNKKITTTNENSEINKTKSYEKNKKTKAKQFISNIKENHHHYYQTFQKKDSIKIKNPLLNLNLKLNMNSKTKIKELLKQNKVIKIQNNNLIKPKNPLFQSKEIIKIKTLSKKGFWHPGKDKENQDNLFILKNINGNDKYLYMGVCDGHGKYGKEVSNFIINNLPQNLNKNIIN
jgi:hypothetical protein